MSKFWSKIFRKKTALKENIDEEERGPHMPPKELPIEQSFAQKFTACGGKFVYCEKIQDAKDAFNSIIKQYPSEILHLQMLGIFFHPLLLSGSGCSSLVFGSKERISNTVLL